MGTPLSAFTDFMKVTGPAILTGPEDVINEAGKNTYTLKRLIQDKDMSEMIQGGESIKDTIYFDADSGYEHYQPNPEFSYNLVNVLTNWSIPWRFTANKMTWTDHEIGLNAGQLSKGARHHKFKTLKRTKYANFWTGTMNGFEDDLWAVPSNAGMEDVNGMLPYSIPVTINEFADTKPPGFTTIQSINPTTQPKWRNRIATYTQHPLSTLTRDAGWDGWIAMSRLWYQLRFDRLPKYPEYTDPTSVPNFIGASLLGVTIYESALRQANDQLVVAGRQDPAYAFPRFRGIDIVYISNLDTAGVYRDAAGTGFAGEVDTSVDLAGVALADPEFEGPRYYMINGKYYAFVIHEDRYFYLTDPFSPSKQPFTKVVVSDCWHNLACRSRIRQGIVSPAADTDLPIP